MTVEKAHADCHTCDQMAAEAVATAECLGRDRWLSAVPGHCATYERGGSAPAMPDTIVEKALAAFRGTPATLSDRDAVRNAVEAVAAVIWDQGHAACDRDWAFTGDLSTPDEARQSWANPYRASKGRT